MRYVVAREAGSWERVNRVGRGEKPVAKGQAQERCGLVRKTRTGRCQSPKKRAFETGAAGRMPALPSAVIAILRGYLVDQLGDSL
jgi:hypothetical protein